MANTRSASSWGGQQTSKDYEPFMEGSTPISAPRSLIGHAMTGFNQELTDAVTTNVLVRALDGSIQNRVVTLRGAQLTALTFTMSFGSGLSTPALERAKRGTYCKTKFYAVRVCPSDTTLEHAFVYPECVLNPPVRVNDFITIEDTTIAEWQSEVRTTEERWMFAMGLFERYNTSSIPLYDVKFLTEDCVSCSGSEPNSGLVITGGAGGVGDEVYIATTDDQFATVTAVTAHNGVSPAGHVGTSIYSLGNVWLVGFADKAAVAASATGGVLFTADAGGSWFLDSGITECVRGVTKFNNTYIAIGGAGAAQAKMWTSSDGTNWDSVTSTALPASSSLLGIAVDEDDDAFYVVAEDGKLLKGQISAGSIALSDLTSNLPGTPGDLYAVSVVSQKHMAVGGTSGYYAESFDGGVTFTQPAVPTTSTIKALAATEDRHVLGAGTRVAERSILNKFVYTAKSIQNGAAIAGNISGAAFPASRDLNNYAAVSDTGEVYYAKSFRTEW